MHVDRRIDNDCRNWYRTSRVSDAVDVVFESSASKSMSRSLSQRRASYIIDDQLHAADLLKLSSCAHPTEPRPINVKSQSLEGHPTFIVVDTAQKQNCGLCTISRRVSAVAWLSVFSIQMNVDIKFISNCCGIGSVKIQAGGILRQIIVEHR